MITFERSIRVLPANSIEIISGEDKQKPFWLIIEHLVSERAWWEKSLVDCSTVSLRIDEFRSLTGICMLWDDGKIKHMR